MKNLIIDLKDDFTKGLVAKNVLIIITLKVTPSCCSLLVEPIVKIIKISDLNKKDESVTDYISINSYSNILFDPKIFEYYPRITKITLSRQKILRNKIITDIEPIITPKEDCTASD